MGGGGEAKMTYFKDGIQLRGILLLLLFSRLFDVSTSSCAHLTIIFFLQLPLSFQSSSINPFSPQQSSYPFRPGTFGFPRFLLPGGLHFIISFGSLPSSILWTCPYHFSCFVLISSKRDLVTFIFCLIIVFLILSLDRNTLHQISLQLAKKHGECEYEFTALSKYGMSLSRLSQTHACLTAFSQLLLFEISWISDKQFTQ